MDNPFTPRANLDQDMQQELIDQVIDIDIDQESDYNNGSLGNTGQGLGDRDPDHPQVAFYFNPPLNETTSGVDAIQLALECIKDIIKGCKKAFRKFLRWLLGDSVWGVVKYIPALNTVVGALRIIRQINDGEYAEAAQTACWAVGGAAGILAAIFIPCTCFVAFVVAAPIQNVIGGGGSLFVEWLRGGLRDFSWDDIFEKVYQDVIRYTPILAAGVCPFRLVSQLCNGRKVSAKATAWDFFVAVVTIGIAYGLSTQVDWNAISALLRESVEATNNAFFNFIIRILHRLVGEGVDIIHTLGGATVKRVTRPKFPTKYPNEADFLKYLKDPTIVARKTDNPLDIKNMNKGLYDYLTTCLMKDRKYVDNRIDLKDRRLSALEIACQGGDPIVVQCILAFQPAVTSHRDWQPRILDLLRNTCNPCVLNVLNGPFLTGTNPPGFIQCCQNDNHKRICLVDSSTHPVLNRPTGIPERDIPSRILCIDGGGTRGLIAIIQLLKICKKSPLECFDLLVGTSTGALIILLLVAGKNLDEILVLYFLMCKDIFKRKIGSKELEKMLEDHFGDKKMADVPEYIKIIITTTTIYNTTFHPRFITNFHEGCKDMFLRDVARRAIAVPGYISPVYEETGTVSLDGGLCLHNNPVLAALRNAQQLEDTTVISVGTGYHVKEVRTYSASRPLALFVDMFKCFINTTTDSNGEVLETAKQICQLGKAYLFRLNPALPENVELDEIDYAKLVNAIWATESYVKQYEDVFEEISTRINP